MDNSLLVDITWNPSDNPQLSQQLGFPKIWEPDNGVPFNRWLELQGYDEFLAYQITVNNMFTSTKP